jgi:S-adenosylmethionine synthetase
MSYLFTSESVSEGHPDKIADQISDALLDQFLAYDPDSKVAIETLVTTGQVVIAGEVKSKTYVDVQEVVRGVIKKIGYTKAEYRFDGDSCGILVAIHEQSGDISRGVVKQNKEEQGAGDQGMMFGYACKDTDNYMPLPLELSHRILIELANIRREKNSPMPYLRPDSKSQVTIEYNDDHTPKRVHTIVVSTQHDEFDEDKPMLDKIKNDVINILIPRVIMQLPERIQKFFGDKIEYHVNPTGKFVIGGPHGDSGLTGRKIIVDTYGGKGAHGGGAFSGKDPSKVDRSAAYAARHIAKNMVAAGVADEILIQLAYAIGVAQPVGVYVNSYGRNNVIMNDSAIAEKIKEIFDLRPGVIEERLQLRKPIYSETARYGHMGRNPESIRKYFDFPYHQKKAIDVNLFTWENLDYVDQIKKAFQLI